jgi:hypothetical protein
VDNKGCRVRCCIKLGVRVCLAPPPLTDRESSLTLNRCFTAILQYFARQTQNIYPIPTTLHSRFLRTEKHLQYISPHLHQTPTWPTRSTSTVSLPVCAKHSIQIKSLTSIEVLNIERSATKAEIKKAYHKVNQIKSPPTTIILNPTTSQTLTHHPLTKGRTHLPPRQSPRRAARRSRREIQNRLTSLRNPQR